MPDFVTLDQPAYPPFALGWANTWANAERPSIPGRWHLPDGRDSLLVEAVQRVQRPDGQLFRGAVEKEHRKRQG